MTLSIFDDHAELLLSTDEEHELAECEAIIERGLKTFVDVGQALLKVRDGRLYRKYGTFEDYCRERWGMSQPRAYQMMYAAQTVGLLQSSTIVELPQTESQARPLTQLKEPEQQIAAWQRAVETAPNGKVTATHVQSVVDEMTGRVAPEPPVVYQPMAATVYSHRSVEYYTPVEILEAARTVLGSFDLDPASCEEAQRNVRATTFYSLEDNGLSRPWRGRVWLNPPYGKTNGRSNQEIWAQRLVSEYLEGHVTEAVLLVKAALGYKWFEELFRDWPVCFARSRLSFILEDGNDEGQSKQGTALFYFGENVDLFARTFRQIGRIIPPEAEVDAALFGQ